MSIIEVANISFRYPGIEVLTNLSFEVEPQSFLAVVGPNGAGKSTLIKLLCRMLKPRSGLITIDSTAINSYSVAELARKVAVVQQEFVPMFDFTVAETVAMARTPYLNAYGFETQADKEIVAESLEMTDAARFWSRRLAELSAGERQRVYIARALAQDAAILLLDEPTSFLDLKHQVGIYDLLKTLQLQKGRTIVAVTHDINLAAQYCEKALLLNAAANTGSYHIGRPEDVFSPERIETVFGVRTYTGVVGNEKFFLPLGKFAKYSRSSAEKPTDKMGN